MRQGLMQQGPIGAARTNFLTGSAHILAPQTKLATHAGGTRWWHTTTLAEEFGMIDADEHDLCAAMDWLLARQHAIQNKLAVRHLREAFTLIPRQVIGGA